MVDVRSFSLLSSSKAVNRRFESQGWINGQRLQESLSPYLDTPQNEDVQVENPPERLLSVIK